MSQVVGLPNNSYKPITNTAWVRTGFCKLQIGCTRLAATRDNIYQLLAHGQWFFPGTPASSTTKTGRHDVAEILLKVALNTINQKSINQVYWWTISSRGYDSPRRPHVGTDVVIIYSFACYLRNKSWKPECVLSFNMDWRILVSYPESEARDKICYYWYKTNFPGRLYIV